MFLRAFAALLRALAARAFFERGARAFGCFRASNVWLVENSRDENTARGKANEAVVARPKESAGV